MFDMTFLGAAFAQLLSFFTPCILPVVPFYLCYMTGLSISGMRDGDGIPTDTQRLVVPSIFFALGVTAIFMILGQGVTAIR